MTCRSVGQPSSVIRNEIRFFQTAPSPPLRRTASDPRDGSQILTALLRLDQQSHRDASLLPWHVMVGITPLTAVADGVEFGTGRVTKTTAVALGTGSAATVMPPQTHAAQCVRCASTFTEATTAVPRTLMNWGRHGQSIHAWTREQQRLGPESRCFQPLSVQVSILLAKDVRVAGDR